MHTLASNVRHFFPWSIALCTVRGIRSMHSWDLYLKRREDALIEYNTLAIAHNSAVFLGLLLIEGANDHHGMEFKAQVRVHIFWQLQSVLVTCFYLFFPCIFLYFFLVKIAGFCYMIWAMRWAIQTYLVCKVCNCYILNPCILIHKLGLIHCPDLVLI